MEKPHIVTRNSFGEWLIALALCTGVTAFMWAYHDWWRAKPYSWLTLNETTAQGAIFGLCAALSLGPLFRLAPRLFASAIRMRRTLGVSGVIFASIHILITLIPLWSKFGWTYITGHLWMAGLGICAALIMAVMAVLSFKNMLSRLGLERWCRIQRLGYLAVVLVCAHFLVLGKFSGWAEWFRTRNHPLPPGSLPVCILASIPLLLKGAEWVRARRSSCAQAQNSGAASV